ncbi:uncharacterized protein BDW70DRAFT_72216, partial [Aspergillus foveolatus]|uniref:uncharacterized protein n=1 Tax=Aspergillus foveolatus TaxID=210207 RepID=UPI003CCCE7A9
LYPESGIRTQDILCGCLQGLVRGPDHEGHVWFAASSVRQYIISGTTDLHVSSLNSSHCSSFLSLKQAYRGATIDLLQYMATPAFEAQIQQFMDDPAKVGLVRTASTSWIWLITRTTPTAEVISRLTNYMHSLSCQKLFTCLAERDRRLAVAQCYDIKLEKWLHKAQSLSSGRSIASCLAQCRSLVFQTIGKTFPSDYAEVIMTINCLGQLHIDSQLFDTAEELFRQGLRVTHQWLQFTKSPSFERLPFYIFGHTADEGQLITLQDVSGRLLALSNYASFVDLLMETKCLSDSEARRTRILRRLQQMRRFKRYGLRIEAAAIYQEVRQELQSLRWECSSPVDTVLGLACLLLEQGRDLEADSLIKTNVPGFVREGPLVLICCSMAATLNNQLITELENAKINGLGTSWEAILAIDRLGRHRISDGNVRSGILFAKRAYQLSQRHAGLPDSRTLHCLQGLVNAHLAEANMNAVTSLFSEIGSLSAPQMRELIPEHPSSKMNFAIMMQQFGLTQLGTTIIEELVGWLREQQEPRYRALDAEYRNTVAINIGGLLTSQGRLQEAEHFLRRALAEPDGLSQTQISAAKTNLAGCLKKQLRTNEANALYKEIDSDAIDPVLAGGPEKGIFRLG